MTYTDKKIILTMLKNNGVYPGDPQMSSIWAYKSAINDEMLFAVFADERHNDLGLSPYVGEFVPLWDCRIGISRAGKEFIETGKIKLLER